MQFVVKSNRYLFLVLVLLVTACSPYSLPTIEAPYIPLRGATNNLDNEIVSAVSIRPFQDRRFLQDNCIQTFLSHKSFHSSVISGSQTLNQVLFAFGQEASRKGFMFTLQAPIVIQGTVEKWCSRVTSGFPSAIFSEAKIKLEVFDSFSGRLIYSGNFASKREQLAAVASKENIQESLALSMGEAIRSALSDRPFYYFSKVKFAYVLKT